MPISSYHDDEFGEIELRPSRGSSIKVRLTPKGTLRANVPHYCGRPRFRRALDSVRPSLRAIINDYQASANLYRDGDKIGTRHHLLV